MQTVRRLRVIYFINVCMFLMLINFYRVCDIQGRSHGSGGMSPEPKKIFNMENFSKNNLSPKILSEAVVCSLIIYVPL